MQRPPPNAVQACVRLYPLASLQDLHFMDSDPLRHGPCLCLRHRSSGVWIHASMLMQVAQLRLQLQSCMDHKSCTDHKSCIDQLSKPGAPSRVCSATGLTNPARARPRFARLDISEKKETLVPARMHIEGGRCCLTQSTLSSWPHAVVHTVGECRGNHILSTAGISAIHALDRSSTHDFK